MHGIFNTFVYVPLYNILIALLAYIPWIDVGIAIIILTILVKLVLFPLSMKATKHQMLLRELEVPMKEIREKYKDDKQEQGRRMLELYKEAGTNPFTGTFLIFVQFPIIIGLYFVFMRGGLPDVHTDLLYSWVRVPTDVHTMFLGIVDMKSKSMVFAALAGVTQFFQAHFTLPKPGPRSDTPNFQEDFARSMQMNVRYVFPVMMASFAYALSAAVALYWITSNIFAIGQELYVRRQRAQEKAATTA